MLSLHLKAWRWSSGKNKDQNILGKLQDNEYPQESTFESLQLPDFDMGEPQKGNSFLAGGSNLY